MCRIWKMKKMYSFLTLKIFSSYSFKYSLYRFKFYINLERKKKIVYLKIRPEHINGNYYLCNIFYDDLLFVVIRNYVRSNVELLSYTFKTVNPYKTHIPIYIYILVYRDVSLI